MSELKLRPAQAKILEYRGGKMAVSAVPGSGKTYTLSLLAAQLIADGRLEPNTQKILIVTYLNSSVQNFRNGITQRLKAMDLEYLAPVADVRTLHSLALEIIQSGKLVGLNETAVALNVLDDAQANAFLVRAMDSWIETYPDLWHAFLPDNSPTMKARLRDVVQRTAKTFIRTAKNDRFTPDAILSQLHDTPGAEWALLRMMAGIYGRYQLILNRQGAFDFDDLIWQAADLLATRSAFADELRQRWPYVLEDEAQDSVPLQEILLNLLVGERGNLVRVGDPNQAITSTFTAAHPRYFNAFAEQEGVIACPLPNSGRCAPLILGAANALLNWVIDKHPVPEVRSNTFRRQDILPTPPGDAQPNPPDSEAKIHLQVYRHREDEELPSLARLTTAYAKKYPERTLAILVPTNSVGQNLSHHLDELGADYDNLLRGGTREREIAAAMHALLAVLADPLSPRNFVAAHESLRALSHPAALGPTDNPDRFYALLRSVHRPEQLLYPQGEGGLLEALPAGVATEEDVFHLERLTAFLRAMFGLRPLPIDDLALALGDELFAKGAELDETDLIIAYQIATLLRQWRDAQPEMRLPDLVAELQSVATGRRTLPSVNAGEAGYQPQAGRITLTTQHSAKGLEWDAVFLVGIDGFWIPGSLEAPFQGVEDFLGGDPSAEAAAQLRYLMGEEGGVFDGRSATESAHIEIISERLRLLYVGITRAKRFLHISRSKATRQQNKERETEPATVLGVLYQYIQQKVKSENS